MRCKYENSEQMGEGFFSVFKFQWFDLINMLSVSNKVAIKRKYAVNTGNLFGR